MSAWSAMIWYSAKRAGAKWACPNKVMVHMWLMHDARLGRAFLFLDILAECTLLSMTVMVTPCLWCIVGMKLVMSYVKFPFARAPFGECRMKRKNEGDRADRAGVIKLIRQGLARVGCTRRGSYSAKGRVSASKRLL